MSETTSTTEAPDFLTALQQDWAGNKQFPAELQCFGPEPIAIDVVRMSWAERRAAFKYDEEDANVGLFLEIPKRFFLRGTRWPLIDVADKTNKQLIKALSEEIPPAATKELLDILLAEEHDLQNAKN